MLTCDLSCFYRKKIVNAETLAHSKLSRVMGVLDVTAIGELFLEIKHLSSTYQYQTISVSSRCFVNCWFRNICSFRNCNSNNLTIS